jgi:hypothetical protein
MCSVRSVVVVEALPSSQLFLEIDVIAISEQLVELVLVASVRSLDLAIELRGPRLDVNVFHAQVGLMPEETRQVTPSD